MLLTVCILPLHVHVILKCASREHRVYPAFTEARLSFSGHFARIGKTAGFSSYSLRNEFGRTYMD